MQGNNNIDIHTTLPMDDLIGLFEEEMSNVVSYDSFEYEHVQKTIHVFRGSPKLHKCHYKITNSAMELGQITLTRHKPFKEEEMIVVENALGALSIHLNNAVEYQANLKIEQIDEFKLDAQISQS